MTEPTATQIVNKLPLSCLPTPLGEAKRVAELGSAGIRELLRSGEVRFVVADVGYPLNWISQSDCFTAWKHEVQPHLIEPSQHVKLEQFPGQYMYFASRWEDGGCPIVLLSKIH